MRQWMVEPKIMCDRHLLGEHLEHHMFIGTILKGKSIKGYIKNNLLEPMSLFVRHDLLIFEMKRRGMNHQSPLEAMDVFEALSMIPKDLLTATIDSDRSLQDLLCRCEKCRVRNNCRGVL